MDRPLKIGYVVVEFPKVTETFILREMVELLRLGADVRLFSLRTVRNYPVHHPETQTMLDRAHYSPFFLSLPLWLANLGFFFRSPGRYLSLWLYIARCTWGNRRVFVRSLGLLPKCVHFACIAQRLGLDRIHAHFASQPAVCAVIIHRLTGIPFGMTPHAFDIFPETVMLAEKLRRAQMVVAISDFNREYFRKVCPDMDERKIREIRYGLRLEEYSPKEGLEIAGPAQILSVASLQQYKGLPFLIEACRLLAARGIDFRCTVIGEGEERADLEARIARAGLEQRVRLPGIFPHDEVIRRYREADLFVLPSIIEESGKMEGLPNALIESLALGLPAVSTRVSGIPELVRDGETGLLVEEQDAEALAAAMERLLVDLELRRRVAVNGREAVQQRHDIRTNAAKLLAIFAELTPEQPQG